jgi:hypothetical protein
MEKLVQSIRDKFGEIHGCVFDGPAPVHLVTLYDYPLMRAGYEGMKKNFRFL